MTSTYWGDIQASTNENYVNGISKIEREQMIVPRRVDVQCPEIYQPDEKCQDEQCVKHASSAVKRRDEFEMDPMVLHTVQLIQYTRKLRRLISAWQMQQHVDTKTGETSIVTSLGLVPKIPEYTGPPVKSPRRPFNYLTKDVNEPASVKRTREARCIDHMTCRALLRRSVATIFSHIGYDNSTDSLLDLVTDVSQHYLTQFTQHLRAAHDHQAQHGNNGFPDIVEQVFCEMGQGSVTSLHEFYQNRVVRYHDNVLQAAEALAVEYETLRSTVDVKPETFTLIKIKDELYNSDIQFPNLDDTDDLDTDQMIQLEGLSNFEITVEQEAVSGLTTEVDSRWNHSVKSETSESRAMTQLDADPATTPDMPPTTPAHSEASDSLQDAPSSCDIMSPPSLTKYNATPLHVRKKKKRN